MKKEYIIVAVPSHLDFNNYLKTYFEDGWEILSFTSSPAGYGHEFLLVRKTEEDEA